MPFKNHFWSGSTFRTKNIHISCWLLTAHSSYDRYFLWKKNYEPHAFYRKHFWCFPHLERRIYTYLVYFCQRTVATIGIPYRYSLSSKNYEPHAFYRKHFWCFPHLERRIYTYLVCFCQRTRTRLHSKVVYC